MPFELEHDGSAPRKTNLRMDWSELNDGPVVLVVEDHEDTRAMLKVYLEMSGCRVLEADNGATAVELAETARPDIVLMDARLPVLDGLSATLRIRSNSPLDHIPIIALTGNAAPQFKTQMIAAGCDYCLIKPLDFAQLTDLIGSLWLQRAAINLPAKYPLMLRRPGPIVGWAG
jgi:CheY-like chemotaxis protein